MNTNNKLVEEEYKVPRKVNHNYDRFGIKPQDKRTNIHDIGNK